eukprot:scaffold18272_cov217-Amphora_coffeaeformis.AAC.1
MGKLFSVFTLWRKRQRDGLLEYGTGTSTIVPYHSSVGIVRFFIWSMGWDTKAFLFSSDW